MIPCFWFYSNHGLSPGVDELIVGCDPDSEPIAFTAARLPYEKLIIVEDHYPEGGIGEMLAEALENSNIKIKHLAVKEIPHSGKPEELLKEYGINWEAIVKEVERI